MQNLIELDKKHFIHPTSSIQQQQEQGAKAIFTKGEGVYITDSEGNVYIDALSSLWNVNIGHGREELALAAYKQMKKLAFSSTFNTFSHEPAIRLAEKIASLTPEGLNAIFFTSGGSESNDTAFKLVRHYWRIQNKPERKKIISVKRGYHGVAAGSTSATGIKEFWNFAGHLMVDICYADNPYKNGLEHAIRSLEGVIKAEGPETIAAFIAEPIQGAGGVLIPPEDYFKQVRKICDKYNILMIADEVITGFGRTGKMFGMEQWDVIPDVITFAKGVTSGYIPLGGVIVSDSIHDTLKEKSTGTLFHGYTYSGHPTATSVALKNIEIIEKEGLVDNAKKMGEKLLSGFKKIKNEIDIVGEVRGRGLIGAIELVKDRETNENYPAEMQVAIKTMEALYQRGVISRAVTFGGTDILCFAPPLIINDQQIDEVLDRLYDALAEIRLKVNTNI